jgi:hypothetical protein
MEAVRYSETSVNPTGLQSIRYKIVVLFIVTVVTLTYQHASKCPWLTYGFRPVSESKLNSSSVTQTPMRSLIRPYASEVWGSFVLITHLLFRSHWPRGLRHELFYSLGRWDRGYESHSRHGYLCVRILCVCYVLYVGRRLATGWSCFQEVVLTLYRKLKSGQGPRKGCRAMFEDR